MFRVRFLVGVLVGLWKGYPIGDGTRLEAGKSVTALRVQLPLLPLRKWGSWCSGFCTNGCEPMGAGSIPAGPPDKPMWLEREGAGLVSRIMLVRIQSSALFGPWV